MRDAGNQGANTGVLFEHLSPAEQSMQVLVYLTVLMVSISTVLLEIHWLTTPPPQPKSAVQASATPPRPKVEGPSAVLSPVYPKKLEPAQPLAETTGVSTNDPSRSTSASPPDNAQNAQAYAAPSKQNEPDDAAASNNRCDIQACASAYRSFRPSDCTYQPLDGPRRVCRKAPEQRADRVQRDEAQRRSWNPREDSREVDRRTRWRVYDEDDGADDASPFRGGRRW